MMKWTKAIVIVVIGAATAWLVWRWAMPPAWWMGGMMTGDETTEQIARRFFGPLLLQKHWLNDTGVDQTQALQSWGQFETLYRFIALVGMQFLITSFAILMIKRGAPTKGSSRTGGPLRGPPAGQP